VKSSLYERLVRLIYYSNFLARSWSYQQADIKVTLSHTSEVRRFIQSTVQHKICERAFTMRVDQTDLREQYLSRAQKMRNRESYNFAIR
jgi:hypothetical protein